MTEITEDMIGCLCWFWYLDNETDEKIIGILNCKDDSPIPYQDSNGTWFRHCRPVKPDEIKLYNKNNLSLGDELTEAYLKGLKEGQEKVDKDYRITCLKYEKDELVQKIHKLEEENRELKERLANVSKTIDHISQEAKEV